MITKLLVGGAIAVSAAVRVAVPASADPNPFGDFSCSCQPAAPAATDQITRGIYNAFSDLRAVPGQ